MIGQTLSHFKITAKLGAGGMGEVYRAEDTELGREVAIKVLPEDLADDPERLARFEREARVLAALNHPNIAAIHQVEEVEGRRLLVMELVEGEDLSERLARGALPLAEALPLALQVAEALEAAHERGVVHRDLKPANVKVVVDGSSEPNVKVLDFGLAKALAEPGTAEADLSRSPTLTARMTQAGAILGTAAYMSPEQANGEEADKRSDIWSFGVLLWEMLTGEPLFAGRSLSETLAAVLRDPIDLEALPDETPGPIRVLLARCLERDRRSRLRDIGEARIALAAQASDRSVPTLVAALSEEPRAGPDRRYRVLAALAAALASFLLGYLLAGGLRSTPPEPEISRLTATLPSLRSLSIGGRVYPLALSPDGRHLAYVAAEGDTNRLYLRRLDRFEARPIADSAAARYPFFSPDGRWIGFFAEGRLLKASIDGGPPVVVSRADPLRGATWAPDGGIYFSNRTGSAGEGVAGGGAPRGSELPPASVGVADVAFRLVRVPAGGGEPELVVTEEPEIDGRVHRWPHALPDGSGLITTTRGEELLVLSFATDRWESLGRGSQAQYIDAGYLVYHAERGRIRAVAFDLATHRTQGESRPVLESVYRAPNVGAAFFATSRNGHLIHIPADTDRLLMRADRSGRAEPATEHVRGFRHPMLSPDGRRVVVTLDPRPSEVWVYDLERDVQTRLSAEGHNLTPVFSPDGRWIVWSSQGELHRTLADGSGTPEVLLARAGAQYPSSWTPDGRQLLYHDETGDSFDIWALTPGEEPTPIVRTRADEYSAKVSPDGAWITYHSNESGSFEVYLRRFPSGADKRPLSSGGGAHPVWSRSGREIFYAGSGTVFSVAFDAGPPVRIGQPEPLFAWPNGLVHAFDVAPDDRSFLLVRTDPDSAQTGFQVVLNWSRELRGLFDPGP